MSREPLGRATGFYRVALKGTGWSIGKWDGYHWCLSGDETVYRDADFDLIVEKPMSDRDLKRMKIDF